MLVEAAAGELAALHAEQRVDLEAELGREIEHAVGAGDHAALAVEDAVRAAQARDVEPALDAPFDVALRPRAGRQRQQRRERAHHQADALHGVSPPLARCRSKNVTMRP